MQPQLIVAYEKDGQPLVEGLRLIVPGANGAAWIAMITSITMSTAGADYPASSSVSVPKAENRPTQSTIPNPQIPNPQLPTQAPSTAPNNAQANVTSSNQPTTTPQTTNQSLNLSTATAYLAGLAFAATFASAVYLVVKRKRKQLL
jgi:DMSO/TMAO reductase YedYZ molybdopterin-dependent catalytic subunit